MGTATYGPRPSPDASAALRREELVLAHLPAAAQWYPLPNILITPANVTAAQAHLSSTAYEADFKTIWGLG